MRVVHLILALATLYAVIMTGISFAQTSLHFPSTLRLSGPGPPFRIDRRPEVARGGFRPMLLP
jgi:hypothetical protein